jgi:hypothetical protein
MEIGGANADFDLDTDTRPYLARITLKQWSSDAVVNCRLTIFDVEKLIDELYRIKLAWKDEPEKS